MSLSERPARQIEHLGAMDGISARFVRRHGPDLLRLQLDVRAAAEAPDASLPLPTALEERDRSVLDAWRAEIRRVAKGLEMAPETIGSKRQLEHLLIAWRHGAPLRGHPLATGWRHQVVGRQLLEAEPDVDDLG